MLPMQFRETRKAHDQAIIAHKTKSLYVAYAPSFAVSACGTCQEEAVNSFTEAEELLSQAEQRTRIGV